MTVQIVSREKIKAKAREAFLKGRSRDSHEMNWHASALPVWLEEYDRLANLMDDEQPSPVCHSAPAGRLRIEQAQGAV